MLFGIINVNKPIGLTSHQVVARLRKILGIKQIGHTGTLDPMAVGVLPICVGKATKLIQYLDTSKAYRADILLGVRTDTYDTDGNVIKEQTVTPEREQIIRLLEEFRGEITQTPPMHSAVHYKGKRLYEYARKNIEIPDIPTRKVTVKDIRLVSLEGNIAVVDIDCSGGTYIRSIARDLGEKLGYGACLCGLTRTRSGEFSLEDSFTLEEIERSPVEKFLIPPQEVLRIEKVEINEAQRDEISKGRYIKTSEKYEQDILVQFIFNNTLLAVAKAEDSKLKPIKVFC